MAVSGAVVGVGPVHDAIEVPAKAPRRSSASSALLPDIVWRMIAEAKLGLE